jgi:hypothetical protein
VSFQVLENKAFDPAEATRVNAKGQELYSDFYQSLSFHEPVEKIFRATSHPDKDPLLFVTPSHT